ncbi:DUF4191 domain-containing protein [Gardnerella sp. DNF01141]|uniref:DUF4191 domain-containing protein n=1 Tax=Gardnerella sp. DNF01141 TaxID=2749057 RepID=UPI003BA9A4E3
MAQGKSQDKSHSTNQSGNKSANKSANKMGMQGMFSQIIRIYKYTYPDDKQLPLWLSVAFAAPIVVAIVFGLLLRWSIFAWVMMIVTAVMVGFLLFTVVLTKRADKVGYAKLEGRPGAAAGIVSAINKGGFTFPQQPVWVDPRTKDAIWRGTGFNGIFLVGEGNYERLMHAMDRQEHAIRSVTAGSNIPVYRMAVGNGENQVKLKELRGKVLRAKTLQPSNHKFALLNKIHPNRRFFLTKTELAILNERLRTLQSKSGFGIPKGIDPTRPQRISRRAMRGK